MRVTAFHIWLCSSTTAAAAFSGTWLQQQQQRPLLKHKIARIGTPTRISMSDSIDDDELSKLIGKRNEIKRQKQPEPKPEINEDDLSDLMVDTAPMDYNKMPEFKTKRVARKPDSSNLDEGKGKKQNEDEEQGPEFVDFLSEFEDENEFHIPNRIGFSTSAWGEAKQGFVSKGKLTKKMKREGKFNPGDLQVAYNNLMESGVAFIDTSETYGAASRGSKLSAEQILARCVGENGDFNPLVASTFSTSLTKILSNGIRFGGGSVVKGLEGSVSRTGLSTIELYQAEASLLYPGGKGALANGLAQCLENGDCNFVGVKNMGKSGMKSMAKKLDNRGYSLTSNQFDFSLTNRKAWKKGLIDACTEAGIIPLVSNPLDGGLATGKYTATTPNGGLSGGPVPYKFEMLEELAPLHSVQETVAEKASFRVKKEQRNFKDTYKRYGPAPKVNTDITTTQVAINYIIAKGAVPLVDITDPQQAEEVLGCLGWGLAEDEIAMLDAAASLCGR